MSGVMNQSDDQPKWEYADMVRAANDSNVAYREAWQPRSQETGHFW